MSEKYKELLEQYDIKSSVHFSKPRNFPVRDRAGTCLIKRISWFPQKLALEYEWKEKLAEAGYAATDRYFLTKEESLVTYDRYRTAFYFKTLF